VRWLVRAQSGSVRANVAKKKQPAKPLALEVLPDEGSELRETMGRRVRIARTVLGLTQTGLADRFGKTYGWIGSIEAGAAFPPPFLLYTLRKATGQPFGWFYGEGPDFPTATPGA
jgi:ribosome-binding protein aMBF1 (putative translation factor)